MGKIVAIGGGENGHHNTEYETTPFDKEIIQLTGKEKPNFLFIGLANKYPEYYFEVMDGIYRARYGCQTDDLTYEDIKSKEVSAKKIKKADIIYVGGGNTYKLMTLWRRFGIDKMLIDAYNEDKVLCGVSAGAICWCKYGNSDSRRLSSDSNQLIKVKGLGLIDVLFCPHINKEPFRVPDLKRMMKMTYVVPAVALDRAALVVVNNQYKVMRLEGPSAAEKCYWKNGKYYVCNIEANELHDLSELYTKQ